MILPKEGKLGAAKYMHLYLHNWSLQPFSQDYHLSSYTTYAVCVNFIHELVSFENLFMPLLFTLSKFLRDRKSICFDGSMCIVSNLSICQLHSYRSHFYRF